MNRKNLENEQQIRAHKNKSLADGAHDAAIVPGLYRESITTSSISSGNQPTLDGSIGTMTITEDSSCRLEVTNMKYTTSRQHGHLKVIHFDDQNNSGNIDLVVEPASNQTSGTIEFWIMCNNAYSMYIRLYGDGGNFLNLRFYNSNVYYYTSVTNDTGLDYDYEKWYHLKIEFDCDADTIDFTMNGEDAPDDEQTASISGYASCNYIDDIRFQTRGSETSVHNWLDAIGFSWDDNYNVGDNWSLEPQERGWQP
jgi:hypothetical protein